MDNQYRSGTVCFIVENDKVLLVLIEYSPTDRKWNGIGGMTETGESLADAVVREVGEETYLIIDKINLKKVAVIGSPDAFQLNVFVTDKFSGELKAKDPTLKEFKWFPISDLPFDQMFPGNGQWLPKVLTGKLVRSNGDKFEEVASF